MKNVVPDITDVVTTRYISQLGRLRKFKRMWGTTTVNGQEVFIPRHYFYPEMTPHVKELARFLGVLSDLSGKQDGIDSAWLYLNPNKASDSDVDYDKRILVKNINKAFKGTKATITIGPKIVNRDVISPPIITSDADQEALKAEIISKFRTLWDEDYQIATSEEDKYSAVVITYLLTSQEVEYTITNAHSMIAAYSLNPAGNKGKLVSKEGRKWQLTVEVPDHIFTEDTDLINLLFDDLSSVKLAGHKLSVTTKFIASLISAATSPFSIEGTSEDYESFPVTLNDFWFKYDGMWYLKTSIFTSPLLKKEDRLSYVFKLIDTDYRKKKLKWYEVAAAIIVVAVISYFSFGAGTAAAAVFTSGAVVAVVTISVAISIASMYIALAAMALNYLGAPNVSAALGTFQRQIAPLVRVANIIAIVAVVTRIVQAGLERAAEMAAKEAAEQGITEGVKVSAVTAIKEISIEFANVAIETLTGIPTTKPFQLQHALKTVDIAFGLYQKNELSKISDDIKSLQDELAEEKALEESSQVSDLVKDMMMAYPNPLSNDYSEYASIYDKPYEWWSTEFHTGNIQNTNVSALWLSDV